MPNHYIKLGDDVDVQTSYGIFIGKYIRKDNDGFCIVKVDRPAGKKIFYKRKKTELRKHVWLERC